MTTRAAGGLEEFLGQLTDRVAGAEVAGSDETGLRVAGKLHWVHCARTDRYTLITCHAKRGRTGIDDAGVLGRFRGVAVHDAWAPYDTYVDVEHQLCCAHALWELQAVADTAPSDIAWCWAGQAADALVAMQRLVADAIARSADTVDADALNTQTRFDRGRREVRLRAGDHRRLREPAVDGSLTGGGEGVVSAEAGVRPPSACPWSHKHVSSATASR
jgi:hypothetical protein